MITIYFKNDGGSQVDIHHEGEVPLTDLMEYLAFAPASPSSGHQWVAEAVKALDAQCKGAEPNRTTGGYGTDHLKSTCSHIHRMVNRPYQKWSLSN